MKRDLLGCFDIQQLQPLNGFLPFAPATRQRLSLQSG